MERRKDSRIECARRKSLEGKKNPNFGSGIKEINAEKRRTCQTKHHTI